jgi:hypothetical protein
MMYPAFHPCFRGRVIRLIVLACVPLIPSSVISGCKSESNSYVDPTLPAVNVEADSEESAVRDEDEAVGAQRGSTSLRSPGSGSLGDPSRVVGRDWRLLRTEDFDRRVVFWCHVPSVANSATQYMDVLRSQDCLVWYIHVGADRTYVRRSVYQVSESSVGGKRSNSGDASRVIYVSDPPGLACDEGCTTRAVIDEMVGEEPAKDVGVRSESIPLAQFPVLLEWQVVALIKPTDKPTWLAATDRRVLLSGSQVIREDCPPPPNGRLAVPSHRLSLCGQQLQQLLQQLSAMRASEAAMVLRVSPAPGAVVDPGESPVPLITETRIPITKERVQACLENKAP